MEGNIEYWKDLPEAPSRYRVSTYGRVMSKSYLKRGRNRGGPFSYMTKTRPLSQSLTHDGYWKVKLRLEDGSDWGSTVHRLVALTFLPNPDGLPVVNHKDSNRQNNMVGNLEWRTAIIGGM